MNHEKDYFSKFEYYQAMQPRWGILADENGYFSKENMDEMHEDNREGRFLVYKALRNFVEDFLYKNLLLENDSKVLEVGCGDGFFSRFLCPDRLKNIIYSFDINLRSVSQAKQNSERNAFMQSSAYRISVKTASMDAVLGYSSFDSLLGLTEALNETARVLKPGGKLILFQDLSPNLHDPLDGGGKNDASTDKYNRTLLSILDRYSNFFDIKKDQETLYESSTFEKASVITGRIGNFSKAKITIDNYMQSGGVFALVFDRGETKIIPKPSFVERLKLPSICRDQEIKTNLIKYFPKKDEVLEWVRMYALSATRK